MYGTAFVLGSILLIVLLFINAWDLSALLSKNYMLFLFSVSGVTMKVLSGIGIMLTYASICTMAFGIFSDGMKGNAVFARRVKLLLLVPIVAIAGYGIYKIIGAFLPGPETLLDVLITLYGVWSLMISVYLLPVLRGNYQPQFKESTTDKLRKHLGDTKYSLWSGYQTRVHKDYGKAYAKEYERYGEKLDKIRAQLSGVLLLPLGLALIVVPPLVMLLVVVWIRSLTLHKRPLTLFERGLLVIIVMGVLLLSSFIILTFDLSTTQQLVNVVYGFGILASIIVLAHIVTTS